MKDDLALTGTGEGLITSTSLVGAAIGDEGWQTLLDNLSQICEVATQKGIRAVLHPHVGTMIENTAATAAGAGGLVDRDRAGDRDRPVDVGCGTARSSGQRTEDKGVLA